MKIDLIARMACAIALLFAAPAAAQTTSLADWWQTSFGRPMPATVQPEAYSRELSARGIGCQTSARPPDWALAEAIGRVVLERWRVERRLPGQSIGTWKDDADSAFNNGPQRFLACQIANRGAAPDSAFAITHGARSFPDIAQGLIAGLAPAGGGDAASIERARADGAAAMKSRALAAIGGL